MGAPAVDLLVNAYPLHEIVAGNRSNVHGDSSEADGAFRIELPAAWHAMPLGVAVSSPDHEVAALVVARALPGQTLVVSARGEQANRLDGIVRIPGPLEQGHWLMPIERARALIAGGDYDESVIRLGDVTLNLQRPAWQDEAFGLAVVSRDRAPAAYRRFEHAAALREWLDGRPEIVVANCEVRVPSAAGQAVSRIEYGLQQVPQFGVVWWGEAEVVDGRFELCAEAGTAFVAVGRREQGTAIGTFRVEQGEATRVEWSMTLPGTHVLDVQVDRSLATSVRQFDVRAVPILDDGVRVQARSAWPTAKGLVGDTTLNPLVVRLPGMAAGRYELQVVVDRRVVASSLASVPGEVPLLTLPGSTSVVFELESQLAGRSPTPIDVSYVLEDSASAAVNVRLPTGIGGFEGFALQRVPPGEYRFCLRHPDGYGEGRFTVTPGVDAVRVRVVEERVEWIEGVVDPVEAGDPCIVAVVAPHVVAPWLSAEADKDGVFRLGVPVRYLARGLEVRLAGGSPIPLTHSGDGRWSWRD